MAIDFQNEFAKMMSTKDSDAVKSIYDLQPSFTPKQIKTITTLRYVASKYNLKSLDNYVTMLEHYISSNKDLGFFSSSNVKSMLRAVTMQEYMRGIDYHATTQSKTDG